MTSVMAFRLLNETTVPLLFMIVISVLGINFLLHQNKYFHLGLILSYIAIKLCFIELYS